MQTTKHLLLEKKRKNVSARATTLRVQPISTSHIIWLKFITNHNKISYKLRQLLEITTEHGWMNTRKSIACITWRFSRAQYWAAKPREKFSLLPPHSPRSLPALTKLGLFAHPTKTSLHNRRFMNQARQTRHFMQSAKRVRRATRGEEKNNLFFASPSLTLRTRFVLQEKYRVRLARLIKHLLYGLTKTMDDRKTG